MNLEPNDFGQRAREAEEDRYDAWFEAHEEELEEVFFEKHSVDRDEEPRKWEAFVEGQYEAYRDASR